MPCGIVAKCLKFPEKGIINITKGVCQAVITKESCAEYAEMARRLLCGEGIKDAAKARRRIDAGRVAFGVYLVTLSENPGNLLEIVPSYMLIQKSYYARCPEIVGMAKGKDEAIDLAVDIVKNIYGETGAFQVKEYFKNR